MQARPAPWRREQGGPEPATPTAAQICREAESAFHRARCPGVFLIVQIGALAAMSRQWLESEAMKTGIHPEYTMSHVHCSCGNQFYTRSTSRPISTSSSAPSATRSTPASRSWSTPVVGSSGSSAAPPSAPRPGSAPAGTGRPVSPAGAGRAARTGRRNGADPLRMPDGALVAKRDAPARRAGGARGRDDARHLGLGGGRSQARRARSTSPPSRSSPGPSATGSCGCRSSAASVALAESMKIGFRALAISANAQLDPDEQEEIGGFTWGCTIFLSLLLAVGPLLRDPGRCDQPDQGPARLGLPLLARRGGAADDDLHRLHRRDQPARATCAGSSSTTAPSTRRSPATRPTTA